MDLGDIELKNCQLSQKDNSLFFHRNSVFKYRSVSADFTADVKAAGTIEDGKITVLLDIAAKAMEHLKRYR